MKKTLIGAALFLVAIICTSCAPEQTPGTIHLEGDSVTFNTYYGSGVQGIHTTAEFSPGASADRSPWTAPASERVPQYVQEGRVETLIWALGLNDISQDRSGWTTYDEDLWYHLLVEIVPNTSCVVIVKPWVLDFYGRPIEEMNELRDWIDELASTHPNVVVVDWRPILEANPEFSATDGIHIDPGTGGPEARDGMYREGVSRCAS